jgi:hypothetical protein
MGVLAITAVAGSIQTFLKPSELSEKHNSAGRSFFRPTERAGGI